VTPNTEPDFGALLLSVLDQTTLRLNLRDDEGRFVAFGNRPEVLPVSRDATVGRASWDGSQYLRADGRERSMLDHPAQEARRTGIAQTGKRLGIRFANGEEHWFLGDFIPVERGPAGYEVLSVLQDVTALEVERREAVQLATELRRVASIATALAVTAPRTCEALGEAIRAPMDELLPACHLAIGRYRAGWDTAQVLVLNEIAGMAPFDRRPRRAADLSNLVERGETRVNNDLGPADIVGPRAIGTDQVPARSSVLVPVRAERERSVLAAYSQQPHFFTNARVAALEALVPVLAATLDAFGPAAEAAA